MWYGADISESDSLFDVRLQPKPDSGMRKLLPRQTLILCAVYGIYNSRQVWTTKSESQWVDYIIVLLTSNINGLYFKIFILSNK